MLAAFLMAEIMEDGKLVGYLGKVLENRPADWLKLTTHRLDIYVEKLAKVQFLERFESLYEADNADASALSELPTAFDYIRLGHPLSCVLEWALARKNSLSPDRVISFSSQTAPVLAILRKNRLANKNTQINYTGELPVCFDADLLRRVYGYHFELKQVQSSSDVSAFDGSTIFLSQTEVKPSAEVDFQVRVYPELGSVVSVLGDASYVSEIQHFRRRETIAMTPPIVWWF